LYGDVPATPQCRRGSRHSTDTNDFSTLLGLNKVPGNIYQFLGDGSLALHTYKTKTHLHEIKIRS
jgi:hypothetical protein